MLAISVSGVLVVTLAVVAYLQARPRAIPGQPSTATTVGARDNTVAVVARDFTVRLALEGQSEFGDAVQLVPHSGLVATTTSPVEPVRAGQLIGRLRVNPDVVDAAAASTSSITRSQVALLRAQTGPLRAPSPGVLVGSRAHPALRSPGVNVVARLTPLQALRFRSASFTGTASVETVLGQQQVPCETLWIGSGDSPELLCRLPSYAETVPGLRATLTITTATIHDAVVVPNLALRYRATDDSYVVVLVDGGARRTVPVTVGVTDGVARVVTSRLPVGAKVLLRAVSAGEQFPGLDSPVPTPTAT